ncbi:MAG: hypothetical protein GQF41_0165 [Candidatus Rifleibacterium amylolyticum]|nr:MAG: hypothetical protein GQF41_0165 [Candidatus Rifleibacterium amylolyticum]
MRTRFSGEDLNSLSREELYELAQKLELKVRKNSSREKLVEALLPHAQEPSAKKASPRKTVVAKPASAAEKKSATKATAKTKAAAAKKTEDTEKKAGAAKSTAARKVVKTEKSPASRKPAISDKSTPAGESDKSEKAAGAKKSAAPKKSAEAKVTTAQKSGAAKTAVAKASDRDREAVSPVKKRGRPAKAENKAVIAEEKTVAKRTTRKSAAEKSVEENTPVRAPRGRPAKGDAKASTKLSAPEKKSSAKAPRKAVEPARKTSEKKPDKSEKNKEALAKSAQDKAVAAETPVSRKRGRPAKSAVAAKSKPEQELIEEKSDVSACDVSEAAVKGLTRGFAKKSEDSSQTPRSKKGAEVFKDGVAVPVESADAQKIASPAADKIERERAKRYSSLKTTMEVPIFQAVAPIEAASTISEEELTGELPQEYGETRIVLQIRDPHWAYAYWEVPRVELKRIELEVGIFEFAHSHFVLRLHNVSEGFSQEIKLSEHARNWYIYLENPQTVYQVELGMQSPSEGYTFIALSNLVQTPPDRVAENWAAPVVYEPESLPEPVERLGGHEILESPPQAPGIPQITEPAQVYFISVSGDPVPHPGSSDLLAGQRLQPLEQPSAEAPFAMPGSLNMPGSFVMPGSLNMPTSFAPTSSDWTSPGADSFGARPTVADEDDIFLMAAVEVIVYGRVKTGCDLTFQGHPLQVRPDGSFSLRMALPFDSGHSIDLVATDPRTGKQRLIKAAVSLKKS